MQVNIKQLSQDMTTWEAEKIEEALKQIMEQSFILAYEQGCKDTEAAFDKALHDAMGLEAH